MDRLEQGPQPRLVFAERILCTPALGDIQAHPRDAVHLPALVADRDGMRQHPAHFTIRSDDPEFHVAGILALLVPRNARDQ